MENENKIQDLVDRSENGFSSWSDGRTVGIDLTDRFVNVGFTASEFKEFAQNIAQTLRRLEHTPDPMWELYKTSKCFKDVAIDAQTSASDTIDLAYYEGEENAYTIIMEEIEEQRKEVWKEV